MYRLFKIVALLAAGTALACAEKADEQQLLQMCNRLLELRGKVGDSAMRSECVRSAREEGVSKRQALCRISAVNTQEYWNRCRTGAPRQSR